MKMSEMETVKDMLCSKARMKKESLVDQREADLAEDKYIYVLLLTLNYP